MGKYEFVLHTLSLLSIILVLYLVYKYVMGYLKFRRINDFSVSSKYDKSFEVSYSLSLFYRFSDFVKNFVVFNGVAKSYDCYIIPKGKLRNGNDYIALKILLGSGLDILYLFSSILYSQNISILSMFILFVLGFFAIDFELLLRSKKNNNIVFDDLYNAIVIMNNSLKSRKSIDDALNDVVERTKGPIKMEFQKVIYDMNLGLSLSESFKKMYERTKIGLVLELSNLLSIMSKSGIKINDVFEKYENRLLENEKIKNKIHSIKKVNCFYYIIFILMPIVIMLFLFLSNNVILDIFQTNLGLLFFILLVLLYSFYLYILRLFYRGRIL